PPTVFACHLPPRRGENASLVSRCPIARSDRPAARNSRARLAVARSCAFGLQPSTTPTRAVRRFASSVLPPVRVYGARPPWCVPRQDRAREGENAHVSGKWSGSSQSDNGIDGGQIDFSLSPERLDGERERKLHGVTLFLR